MRGSPVERYQSAEALLDDLRALSPSRRESGSVAEGPVDDRLWWWKCHQAVIAIVHAAMPIAAWATRKTIGGEGGQMGRVIFFMTLALATMSVTLRLNLLFSARVDREGLPEHRARVFPTVVASDLLLILVLLSAAVFVAAAREEFAALIVVVSVASLASLILIEPATTKSAGLSKPSRRP
jgi:hypothetical protein